MIYQVCKKNNPIVYEHIYTKIVSHLKEKGSSLHVVEYGCVVAGREYRMFSKINGEMSDEIEWWELKDE
jgi:hypothetical protein